jgi:hypothetical protein
MATHRGLNLSNIAQEGLEGLPGVLIAVFFAFGGVFLLLGLFAPDLTSGEAGTWFTIIYIAVSVVACIAYVLGQRRDRRLSAELQQQFHDLSGPARQAGAPTTPAGVDESAVDGHLPSAPPSDPLAPEAVLAVIVWFFFLWGMMAMFVAPKNQNALLTVFAGISGGIVIASIFVRVRNRWRARRMERVRERRGGQGD